jgi:uncharacterized protein
MTNVLSDEQIIECTTISRERLLKGIVHLPVNVSYPPAVIILHGYASCKEGKASMYERLASSMTDAGIAVFRFDFSGCGESGGDFSSLNFEDLIHDAKQMILYAFQHPQIDSQRIGVYGSSMGGALALFAAKELSIVKSMVLWAPVASGPLWLRDFLFKNPLAIFKQVEAKKKASRGRKLSKEFQRQFRKMRAFMQLRELKEISVLHLQGNKDKTLSLSHQKAFKDESKKSEAKIHFVTFDNVGHSIDTEDDTQKLMQLAVEWFKEHLS